MSEQNYETDGLSEETAALAALGRGEEPAAAPETTKESPETGAEEPTEAPADPNPSESDNGSEEAPEWFPKKFMKDGKPDYEALARSYGELEKKQSAPKEDKPEAEEDPEGGDEPTDEAPIPADLFQSAQAEYAENGGELTEDTYNKLAELVGSDTLDTYLAGVKSLEAALTAEVYDLAGSEEDYRAAVEWAREAWGESKIEKFDSALTDDDMRSTMVRVLMSDYRDANPGEGTSTERVPGVPTTDTYSDPEEFTRDLAAADEAGDALARRKAVQKLERSKKAGTLEGITPRTGLKRFGRR